MKVILNKIIPFGSYNAINLCGLVLSKRPLTQTERNHEYIHTLQQRELVWIVFFVWYIAEWLIHLVRYRNAALAYRAISFEREAYAYQSYLSYPRRRPLWAWRRFAGSRADRKDRR